MRSMEGIALGAVSEAVKSEIEVAWPVQRSSASSAFQHTFSPPSVALESEGAEI